MRTNDLTESEVPDGVMTGDADDVDHGLKLIVLGVRTVLIGRFLFGGSDSAPIMLLGLTVSIVDFFVS